MIYAVGDIHGQCEKLRALLDMLVEAGLASDDLLVFMGDYIDRGPDSAGVIDTLIKLKKRRPNTVFLRGNHEQMMMDARRRFEPSFNSDNSQGNCESGVFWFVEGGVETMNSYGPPKGRRWMDLVPSSHWAFLRSTQMELKHGAYRFVHAGVLPPGKSWSMPEFDTDPRLWIRYEFIGSDSDFGGKTIVFGHTPTRDGKPLMMWNKVAIDTGAGNGGPLTAVALPQVYNPSAVLYWQA
jgi:serine/threonine protein phosphatase 1